jgi:hypothetical protein
VVRICSSPDAAQLASLADETPEGRSIVVLAKQKYGIRGRDLAHQLGDFLGIWNSHRAHHEIDGLRRPKEKRRERQRQCEFGQRGGLERDTGKLQPAVRAGVCQPARVRAPPRG